MHCPNLWIFFVGVGIITIIIGVLSVTYYHHKYDKLQATILTADCESICDKDSFEYDCHMLVTYMCANATYNVTMNDPDSPVDLFPGSKISIEVYRNTCEMLNPLPSLGKVFLMSIDVLIALILALTLSLYGLGKYYDAHPKITQPTDTTPLINVDSMV
jgi:hypothetical protein